jgi:hypothetical protein
MPFIYYNTSGVEEWNSDTVGGGTIADVRVYTSSDSVVLYYPTFAGRSVKVVGLLGRFSALGVTADVGLGYPRVTVASGYATRKFAVVVI